MLLALANESRVEAGTALALDRDRFSALVSERILSEPLVRVQRREVTEIPDGEVILATGPAHFRALGGNR
jgi:methylenetetrahydrofolate--tRNA-(uracil-5-)-methyltransferase